MLGNTATSAEVKQEIQRVVDSPCTSFWLKEAFEVLLQRDCLDAARDAEVLAHLLGLRAKLILGIK